MQRLQQQRFTWNTAKQDARREGGDSCKEAVQGRVLSARCRGEATGEGQGAQCPCCADWKLAPPSLPPCAVEAERYYCDIEVFLQSERREITKLFLKESLIAIAIFHV